MGAGSEDSPSEDSLGLNESQPLQPPFADIYSESLVTKEVLPDEPSKIYILPFELLVLTVGCAQLELAKSPVCY